MKVKRGERELTVADNVAGSMILGFLRWMAPTPEEKVHRCERPGSQASYRDHENKREIARYFRQQERLVV